MDSNPFEINLERQLDLARQLASRLERLSADSSWARRASGYRAALLKSIQNLEQIAAQPVSPDGLEKETQRLSLLVERGYQILDLAGRELVRGRRLKRPN